MDLDGFLIGDVARVGVVEYGFEGSEQDVLTKVTFEVEDVDGSVRFVEQEFEPGTGPSVETLDNLVRLINRRIGGH